MGRRINRITAASKIAGAGARRGSVESFAVVPGEKRSAVTARLVLPGEARVGADTFALGGGGVLIAVKEGQFLGAKAAASSPVAVYPRYS